MLNTGILADFHSILKEEDINYEKIQESLDSDPVYKILKELNLLGYNNLDYFLFDDYL